MFNSNELSMYYYIKKVLTFDFDKFPIKLSRKTVDYSCPICKYKFQAPIEDVLELEIDNE